MRKLYFVVIVLFVVLSCKKNKLGGSGVIEGHMRHHAKAISRGTVFIKFNAKEFPGSDTNIYDAKVHPDTTGYYKFEVYKGNYYVYGFGYDFSIPAPYQVAGGVPVKVRTNEKVVADLPVTEKH
ncbi:MAG: hypothetical protein JNM96_06220 [Bacteroidia bacterium]|nr:hypothetical protein [Bacteroidia bacterium]